MPEGPECHRAALRLEQKYIGCVLEEIRIISGRYAVHGVFAGHEQLVADIRIGLVLRGVGAKGKLIIWVFENGMYLHCTLGLKGRWLSRKEKHSGVCLAFNRGQAWFDDQLHYGTLKYCDSEMTTARLSRLGPDVCRIPAQLSYDTFEELLSRRPQWDISRFLMDQSKISGLGNYLKSDVLYLCGIHPLSECGNIPPDKRIELFKAVLQVPRNTLASYAKGGRARKVIYGKKVDVRGNKVDKVKTGDKRNTHYVPSSQKLY